MKIFRNIEDVNLKGFAATVGIFDGVHFAHRSIINKLNAIAREENLESLIVTLWPHPRYVLNSGGAGLELLNTIDRKIELLEETGLQNLLIIPFTKEFAALSYEKFFKDILVRKLGVKSFVVGFNNQFGKNREGNFEKLIDLTETHRVSLIKVEPFMLNKEKISSTLIRNEIKNGDIHLANKYLGYTFSLRGKVIKGNAVGRKINFPTANILINDTLKIIPRQGVYASKVKVNGEIHTGLLNIGVRPTISDEKKTSIEVHILDFDSDIYNTEIEILIYEKVREEKRFNNLDELKHQIETDKIAIEKLINEKYN